MKYVTLPLLLVFTSLTACSSDSPVSGESVQQSSGSTSKVETPQTFLAQELSKSSQAQGNSQQLQINQDELSLLREQGILDVNNPDDAQLMAALSAQ